MLFHSPAFLFVFLPLTLIGFYGFGKIGGSHLAMMWVLLSSLFFYGWWNFNYIFLILFSIVINYAISRKLTRHPSKIFLSAGIIFNLGLLGFYKYSIFFVENVNIIFRTDFNPGPIILPLAISFFTFQQIAYLVDSYRGKATHSNPLSYGLFVTFFPQLIAGPIVHHREMMPQFIRDRILKPSTQRFAIGLTILTIGLFKKVVIADTLDSIASPIFDLAETGSALHYTTAWIGVLAYSLQIYFDFSGYTDMATGSARLFGIRLPLNFYSPYKAVNIIDFWRRWHVTLSRFLKDYLYIPLGGNRKGEQRRYINLMITMLLGGLWHGASWNFVIWGGLHGLYLSINHMWKKSYGCPAFVARILTFLAITVAWVFFRAESYTGALHILNAMITIEGDIYTLLWDKTAPLRQLLGTQQSNLALPIVLLCLCFVWALPNTSEVMRQYRPFIGSHIQKLTAVKRSIAWRPTGIWACLYGVILAISIWTMIYEPSKVFLYFQF